MNPSSVLSRQLLPELLYLLQYPRARTFQSVRWRGFFFLLTPKKWGSYGEVFAYVSDQCPNISYTLSDACQNHKGRQLPSHLIIFTSGEWNVWRLPLGCLSQISSFSNKYANRNWFKKTPFAAKFQIFKEFNYMVAYNLFVILTICSYLLIHYSKSSELPLRSQAKKNYGWHNTCMLQYQVTVVTLQMSEWWKE